ncbi:hypothetical protein AURDEDRAFT_188501 [Auricularia subglabra TFB-10046 SS5]|nr:hypothetical protein AURDEDRAFT_188501 [Auricularia subglabra TFB-10046 SS5]
MVHRLLPYHVFQHSSRDLSRVLNFSDPADAAPRDPEQAELDETEFAIDCHQRFRSLSTRFRNIRTRDASRPYPGGENAVLWQTVVDSDRSFNAFLTAENKRLPQQRPAPPPLPAYPTLPPGYAYHPYPPPPPPPEAFNTPIPVQLPARLLPVLTNMGIVPVPLSNLPPQNQPQPPCVQLGSSNAGATLNLTINLSLLQPMQMSGLAVLLNSIARLPGYPMPPPPPAPRPPPSTSSAPPSGSVVKKEETL